MSRIDSEPVIVSQAPYGLNHKFTSNQKEDLLKEFTPKFEDPEKRDVAKNFKAIKEALFRVNMHGKTVLDLGAGTGLFAPVLSKRVGEDGKVILSEISDGFLQHLMELSIDYPNVQVLKSSEDAIPIKGRNKVDVVLLCDVYHHFTHPKLMLQEIQRILSPGGRMIFIEFYRDDGRIWSHPKGWVLEHVRAGKATFMREIRECGFVVDQEVHIKGLEENYFIIWRKSRTAVI